MIKKYLYNDNVYHSEYAVRQAIWESEHKIFRKEPEENRAEFWEKFNVTYSEEEQQFTLKELKTKKLGELDRAFYVWRSKQATLVSSLGFEADADERAMIDVSGLVALEAPAVFMDANNVPHELTADQIKILHKEIIQSGNKAYETKWALRNAISAAESKDALEAIELKFEPVNFLSGS
jgi:hypothetical protein